MHLQHLSIAYVLLSSNHLSFRLETAEHGSIQAFSPIERFDLPGILVTLNDLYLGFDLDFDLDLDHVVVVVSLRRCSCLPPGQWFQPP